MGKRRFTSQPISQSINQSIDGSNHFHNVFLDILANPSFSRHSFMPFLGALNVVQPQLDAEWNCVDSLLKNLHIRTKADVGRRRRQELAQWKGKWGECKEIEEAGFTNNQQDTISTSVRDSRSLFGFFPRAPIESRSVQEDRLRAPEH